MFVKTDVITNLSLTLKRSISGKRSLQKSPRHSANAEVFADENYPFAEAKK